MTTTQGLVEMDRYDELMERRAELFAAWLGLVEQAKAAGLTVDDFWGGGLTLTSKGHLWVNVHDGSGRVRATLEYRAGADGVALQEGSELPDGVELR